MTWWKLNYEVISFVRRYSQAWVSLGNHFLNISHVKARATDTHPDFGENDTLNTLALNTAE
jgi:hypothetical protein